MCFSTGDADSSGLKELKQGMLAWIHRRGRIDFLGFGRVLMIISPQPRHMNPLNPFSMWV